MPARRDIRSDLLASEVGRSEQVGPAEADVTLVYPNSYAVGMSSLGYQVTYGLAAGHPGIRAERFFADLPGNGTLESNRPLGKADVVAFSVSFVMDWVGLVDIVDRAGLPPLARERGEEWPLVVVGGTAVSVNRLPVYDVCDVLVHGAAELTLPPLLEAVRAGRGDGASRAELLQRLSAIPGLEVTAGAWVAAGAPDAPVGGSDGSWMDAGDATNPERQPCLPFPASCDLDDLSARPARSAIVSSRAELAGKCLIEISRGCPRRCAFCWAGHNIRPYVVRPARDVVALIEEGRALTRSFGLIAAAVGAHPEIDDICRYCDENDLAVSFSSLRVEDVTDGMLRTLARSGQRSLTLAPETASPRLRKLLGKRIEDEQVFEVVERAVSLGLTDAKLYFMVGLPTETSDEAQEIARFVERLRTRFVNASRPKGRIGAIAVNCDVYVPEPNTPLARVDGRPPRKEIRSRLRDLARALRRQPNVRINAGSADLAVAQEIVCNGDRRALDFVRLAHRHGGSWRRALKEWPQTSQDR